MFHALRIYCHILFALECWISEWDWHGNSVFLPFWSAAEPDLLMAMLLQLFGQSRVGEAVQGSLNVVVPRSSKFYRG